MKSIVQTDNWDECFICHRAPSEVHHIFGKYEATHTRDEFMQRYGRNYL